MPSLSELQSSMANALLAVDPAARALPADWFIGHGERGLRTHRNNILGACSNALRLSYPTIDRLIGSGNFDALAADFVRAAPPAGPLLAVYGEGFGGFVVARAAAADRALLDEVARFDWLFERVAQAPPDDYTGHAVMLEGAVQLRLCSSLKLFRASFTVDELRAGVYAGTGADAVAMAMPAARQLALWRRAAGVAVQSLQPSSAAFLATLLSGADLEAALTAATAAAVSAAAIDELPARIESEILRASFVQLIAS